MLRDLKSKEEKVDSRSLSALSISKHSKTIYKRLYLGKTYENESRIGNALRSASNVLWKIFTKLQLLSVVARSRFLRKLRIKIFALSESTLPSSPFPTLPYRVGAAIIERESGLNKTVRPSTSVRLQSQIQFQFKVHGKA